MENVKVLSEERTLILYWDKPEAIGKKEVYQIFLDDILQGKTTKTHFKIKNLEPGAEYIIAIKRYSENQMVESHIVTARTMQQKKYIDISRQPYCAVGDGKTLNTERIQRAIDDCGKNEGIYIPKGIYLTGALHLHSDMEVFLDEGAVLQGSDKVEDYLPKIWSRFEGTELECYSSLLNLGQLNHKVGYTCKDVVIRGSGTIAGGGRRLAKNVISLEKERMREYLEKLGEKIQECENENTIPGRVRPRLINISNAQNIRITGLTLKNGASWNVHMIYSDSIVTDHCTFHSKDVWNGDGWDPDSSSNCTIFACVFYTGDDAIAIKSGKNPEGNIINRPSKEIRIFDCSCAFGNGVAIGSEMSGGVSDVKIWDCDFSNSMYGLEIKGTRKRGGYVRNVQVRNCSVPRILFHSVGYNDDGIGAQKPPVFENCIFKNMTITGVCLDLILGKIRKCNPIELQGFEEEEYHIRNVEFKDIVILNRSEDNLGIFIKNCREISFSNMGTKKDENRKKRMMPFAGRKMYVFGDSIMKGHTYFKGAADFAAEEQEIRLKKYAVNGAAVLNTGITEGQILHQLYTAPEKSPDYILFDGGTNDAEYLEAYRANIREELYGTVKEAEWQAFRRNTFAGELENLVCEMKKKWPKAKLIYIAVHRMGSRNAEVQKRLYEIACEVCEKWEVAIADVYKEASLDTSNEQQRKKYTFDECGEDGIPGENGTGTHPNIKAIQEFYLPQITKALLKLM